MIHGYINGIVVGQRAVIASDILGVDRLSSSFGLTVCIRGCGNLIGPFIAGMVFFTKYFVLLCSFLNICTQIDNRVFGCSVWQNATLGQFAKLGK